MFPWRELFDAYIAVTGGHDMRRFWKSSPRELFAWLESLARRKNGHEKAADVLSEGEY